MSNELMVFENQDFGNIRTINIEEKAYFVASDIAKALGYKDIINAIKQHCRWVVKHHIPHPQSVGKTVEVNMIPEGDIYRMIAHSKLPNAVKFESWVFDQVLPQIRQTGGYVGNEDIFINTYLPHADPTTQLLFKTTLQTIRMQNETIENQTNKIEELEPKAESYDKFLDSNGNKSMNEVAKELKIPKFGRTKLFEFLRRIGILMSDNIPYQRFIESGYFVVIESIIERNGYTFNTSTTKVTPKGVDYINKKIKEKGAYLINA
jgi:prophage antirepressor-like protein